MNFYIKKPGRLKLDMVLIHTAFWLLFIVLELTYLNDLSGKLEPAVDYIVYYLLNISLFYCQLVVLDKAFSLSHPKFLKGCLLFISLVVSYLIVKYFSHYGLMYWHMDIIRPIKNLHSFLIAALFRGWYFIFLASFYWISGHLSEFSRRAKEAEYQKLLLGLEMDKRLSESENAYLQQQLNPHLLFNTLNFIYTRVSLHSDEAANSVQLLSEILRYSLEPSGPDGKVPLAAEIQQIKNLIEINAARFDIPLQLKVSFNGDFENVRVIPLILLTFTENLFKHAHLVDPDHPADLSISVDADRVLVYHSSNSKKAQSGYRREGGLGLHNASVRLNFAYGKKYQLAISENADTFELTLNLPL